MKDICATGMLPAARCTSFPLTGYHPGNKRPTSRQAEPRTNVGPSARQRLGPDIDMVDPSTRQRLGSGDTEVNMTPQVQSDSTRLPALPCKSLTAEPWVLSAGVGEGALALHEQGVAFCDRFESDGFVPEAAIPALALAAGLNVDLEDGRKDSRRPFTVDLLQLVAAGLWEPTARLCDECAKRLWSLRLGFVIHGCAPGTKSW
jgi:hypothetical protein